MEIKDIKPSTIMLIAGGAVLLLSTFLDWVSFGSGDFSVGSNGWETDGFGLQGIFVAVIGLAIGGGVAASQFGSVKKPDKILGFDHNQLHLALGLSAFLITFGLQLRDGAAIGILLGWVSAAVIMAAAIMDMRAADGDAAPPSQF
jgi:hypothetical protein